MATKKNEQPVLTPEEREAIKAELKAEVEAEVRASVEAELKEKGEAGADKKAGTSETAAQKKRAEEKVSYMLPLIEGEPEEVNVTVNGKTIQILRGEQVQIPRMYAEVLDNQMAQLKYLKKYQEKKKEQVTIVE